MHTCTSLSNRIPFVSGNGCELDVNCFELLKLRDYNETGNGNRESAKAKRISEIAYGEIKADQCPSVTTENVSPKCLPSQEG